MTFVDENNLISKLLTREIISINENQIIYDAIKLLSTNKITTIIAIVVMLIARQIGLSIKIINNAATIIIRGMILKTMVLYSPIDFSVRIISDLTKAEESLL